MSKEGKPLDHIDLLMWNVDDPTGLVNVTAILTFRERIDFQTIQRIIEGRLEHLERFRQKVIEKNGKPMWVEDELYDIRSHVHAVALPSPGGKAELEEYVGDKVSAPLDYSKPLWQIHVIDNYEGGSAVLWRIHHSIADGASLIKVLLSLTNDNPEDSLNPGICGMPMREEPKHHNPNLKERMENLLHTGENFLEGAKEIIKRPEKVTKYFEEGVHTLKELGSILTERPSKDAMYKGKLGIRKKVALSGEMSLQDIKRIGKKYGGTVNDTLLVALSGAIRRHLEFHHQDTNFEFRVVCPVDMRNHEKGIRLGNRIGVISLDLPVDVESPAERFHIVSRRTKALKSSLEPLLTFEFGHLISGLIPKRIERMAAEFLGSRMMAVVSNVPGPRRPIYLAGGEVDSVMFWLPQTTSMGVGISIISYNEKVMLGVTTDAGLVPDPDRIVEGFEADIAEMLRHVSEAEGESA